MPLNGVPNDVMNKMLTTERSRPRPRLRLRLRLHDEHDAGWTLLSGTKYLLRIFLEEPKIDTRLSFPL